MRAPVDIGSRLFLPGFSQGIGNIGCLLLALQCNGKVRKGFPSPPSPLLTSKNKHKRPPIEMANSRRKKEKQYQIAFIIMGAVITMVS